MSVLQEGQAGYRQVCCLPVDRIAPNPRQPRKEFNELALMELASSIRQHGLLQPITVRAAGAGYEIIMGERRFRACCMLGFTHIDAFVLSVTEGESALLALIENLQREDLNPIEEAAAMKQFMEACHYTQEQAAKKVGKSRPAVANSLRLLSLPQSIQEDVIAGRISAGHARVLAGIEDEKRQLALAQLTILDGLSVRALEKMAAQPEPAPKPRPAPRPLPLELQDMQSRMRETFGLRTLFKGNRKRGKIILQYESEDELEQLYQCLERLEGKQ